MTSASEHLRRWVKAGLLAEDAAARIEAWEAEQRGSHKDAERPGAMEALLYLGLVVLGVGAFSLFAENWSELESWARVLALAVPLVLVLAAGGAMLRSDEPQLKRGSQAAWLLAVALFAGLLAVTFNEFGVGFSKEDERGWLLVCAVATLLFAIVLWVLNPSHAQVLAMAGASFFLGQAIGDWPDEYSQQYAGVALLVAGAAGLALAEAGWLTPRASGRLFFALLLMVGPYEAGIGDGPIFFEFVAGAAAAAIIALGVLRGDFLLVLTGVFGSFIVLISFIFEHFQDRIGAPLALMISGGIVIAGVLLLAVLRRETRRTSSVS